MVEIGEDVLLDMFLRDGIFVEAQAARVFAEVTKDILFACILARSVLIVVNAGLAICMGWTMDSVVVYLLVF